MNPVVMTIKTCSKCPFVDHSGAFTEGGTRTICGHVDAPDTFATNIEGDDHYHWKHRVVDPLSSPPVQCPLRQPATPATEAERCVTVADLQGSDPDFTGDESTDEYIRRIRGRIPAGLQPDTATRVDVRISKQTGGAYADPRQVIESELGTIRRNRAQATLNVAPATAEKQAREIVESTFPSDANPEAEWKTMLIARITEAICATAREQGEGDRK